MGSINVAIIGVGNCASSLVQGVAKYADATNDKEIPGLMHPVLGEYGVGDINFVAAFDIDAGKVGMDLSEAIFAKPNNTVKFEDVPRTGVSVQRGMTHDGVGMVYVGHHTKGVWAYRRHRGHLERAGSGCGDKLTCRWDRSRLPSGMWSRFWRRAAGLSTAFRCS